MSGAGRVRVLMMPDWRGAGNPYQSLLADAVEAAGGSVEFVKGYRRLLPVFRAAALGRRFDVLHLHWIAPYLRGERTLVKSVYAVKFLLDLLLTRLAGLRIVWTVHNRLPHDTPTPRLDLWTRRALVKLVHRIVVHNSSVLESLGREYGFDPGKAEVIPHGHFRGVYGPLIDRREARAALGLPADGHVFLNFGMLRPYKGVERLLRVWRGRGAEFAGDTLLVAGRPVDDSYRQSLDSLAACSAGVVLHARYVPDEEISLYFSAADTVVLPFENILTSSTLVLAMSYGKPVVAPNMGGVQETVAGQAAYLYDPSEPEGLSRALVESKERGSGGGPSDAAQSRMLDDLDWGRVGAKTLRAYEADGRPRPVGAAPAGQRS